MKHLFSTIRHIHKRLCRHHLRKYQIINIIFYLFFYGTTLANDNDKEKKMKKKKIKKSEEIK